MKNREQLIEWLRDAYAMEKGMEVALGKLIERDDISRLFKTQAAVHLVETHGHAMDVEHCLQHLGADVSLFKTMVAQSLEVARGFTTVFARDERVKHALAAYTMEHFEIACYRALKAGAEALNEPAVVKLCDAILAEETAMAGWLSDHLPDVVLGYLRESN